MEFRNKILFFTVITFTFSLLLPASAVAQEEEETSGGYFEEPVEVRKLDEAKWRNVTKDLDYSDNINGERKKTYVRESDEAIDDDAERTSDFGSESSAEEGQGENAAEPDRTTFSIPHLNLGMSGQIILYGLAIAVIAFIIYKLLTGNLLKSDKSEEFLTGKEELNEEDLHESDLDRYLREAMNRKDYKLAVRIYYLIILKELSLRNLISWKKEKTNKDYLYEMSNREDYSSFHETTRLFEKIWYGDSDVSESQFLSISPVFKNFVEGIKRQEI